MDGEVDGKIIVDDFMSLDEENTETRFEESEKESFKRAKIKFNIKEALSQFVLK